MTRRILAVAGAIVLGMVALFALFNALKAVLALAFIAFAGRGLMRLWHGGGHPAHGPRHHRYGHGHHHHGLHQQPWNHYADTQSRSGIQPQFNKQQSADTVVPIW